MKRVVYRLPQYPALSGDVLAPASDARSDARDAFYDALAAVAGDVINDLVESCGPALDQSPIPALAFAPPGRARDTVPIGPCVVAWAGRHNLDVDWIIDDAILALCFARDLREPVRLRALDVAANLTPRLHFGAVRVSLEMAWHFGTQPRGAFKELALARLSDELDAELDRIEAKAMAAGAVRWDRSQVVRHMRWLVMRVCRLMSPARIADVERVPRTDRAIADAVRAAGELIGLPLPALRRGRPPKRRPARIVRRQ